MAHLDCNYTARNISPLVKSLAMYAPEDQRFPTFPPSAVHLTFQDTPPGLCNPFVYPQDLNMNQITFPSSNGDPIRAELPGNRIFPGNIPESLRFPTFPPSSVPSTVQDTPSGLGYPFVYPQDLNVNNIHFKSSNRDPIRPELLGNMIFPGNVPESLRFPTFLPNAVQPTIQNANIAPPELGNPFEYHQNPNINMNPINYNSSNGEPIRAELLRNILVNARAHQNQLHKERFDQDQARQNMFRQEMGNQFSSPFAAVPNPYSLQNFNKHLAMMKRQQLGQAPRVNEHLHRSASSRPETAKVQSASPASSNIKDPTNFSYQSFLTKAPTKKRSIEVNNIREKFLKSSEKNKENDEPKSIPIDLPIFESDSFALNDIKSYVYRKNATACWHGFESVKESQPNVFKNPFIIVFGKKD